MLIVFNKIYSAVFFCKFDSLFKFTYAINLEKYIF